MALTTTPAWPQTPKFGFAKVTTANTALDGSGTITTIGEAMGADGGRITGLYAGAQATVTATAVRFFVSIDSGVTWVYVPYLERLIPAHTVASTTLNAGQVTVIDQEDPAVYLDLPAGALLGCTSAVALAGGIAFAAIWTDF